MRKHLKLIILGSISFFIFVIIILLVHNCFIMKVVEGKIDSIHISSLKDDNEFGLNLVKSDYNNFRLNKGIIKDINNNPNDYRLIVYNFSIKNIADKTCFSDIKIKPNFSKNMDDLVIGYNEKDGEYPIILKPFKKISNLPKYVIVKSKGYSDNILLSLAQKDIFYVSGIIGGNIIDSGYNFARVTPLKQ